MGYLLHSQWGKQSSSYGIDGIQNASTCCLYSQGRLGFLMLLYSWKEGSQNELLLVRAALGSGNVFLAGFSIHCYVTKLILPVPLPSSGILPFALFFMTFWFFPSFKNAKWAKRGLKRLQVCIYISMELYILGFFFLMRISHSHISTNYHRKLESDNIWAEELTGVFQDPSNSLNVFHSKSTSFKFSRATEKRGGGGGWEWVGLIWPRRVYLVQCLAHLISSLQTPLQWGSFYSHKLFNPCGRQSHPSLMWSG